MLLCAPMMRGAVLVVGLIASAGCDRLSVSPFGGAKIQLTLTGGKPTPAGEHLELWARDGEHDIVRLLAGPAADACLGAQTPCTNAAGYAPTLSAYVIAAAVDFNDPCMIDGAGNLLWKPGAQVGPSDAERTLQAKSVETRIHQLTDLQPIPLYAFTSYDDGAAARPVRATDAAACAKLASAPCIADAAVAADRLTACQAFWRASPFAYTGNPLQLTKPVHGQLFGMLDFVSLAPAQSLGGILIITDFALRDLRELWITEATGKVAALDPNAIDCKTTPDTCRGALLVQGDAGTPERGIFRFDLASPPPATLSGTASVLTRLNEDPVQF